jgi:conserved oligomeric Golgi complex subunit 2
LELRELSQGLNKELLDVVNENYQDFLSLGGALHGGEEKVEEIRVGLLGFQRDVTAIHAKVEARKTEMQSLLQEKKKFREKANVGRALLDIAERIEELEQRLMISNIKKSNGTASHSEDTASDAGDFDSDDTDSDGDLEEDGDESAIIPVKKLENHVQKYVYINSESERIGNTHPFVVGQQPRLQKIRSTLLLDLNTALKQSRKAGTKDEARTVKILRFYDLLKAESSAVSALKQLSI